MMMMMMMTNQWKLGFWNGRHPRLFRHVCSPTPRPEPSKLQNFIEIHQRVLFRKFYNVNGPTYMYGMAGMALSYASSTMQQTSGVYVCVCSCKRMTFLLVFNLAADFTFIHFNVFCWWKLQVDVIYWIYHNFTIFFIFFYIFTFHKVVWLCS